MNFSVTGGIGFLGGWMLFGVLMIAFSVVVAIVVHLVRGPDDRTAPRGERSSEDDYIL